jgi:hypothetical protein
VYNYIFAIWEEAQEPVKDKEDLDAKKEEWK